MIPEWLIQKTTKRPPRPFLFLSSISSSPPPQPPPSRGPFLSFLPTPPASHWLPHPLSPFQTLNADSPWASRVVFLDVFRKALLPVCSREELTVTRTLHTSHARPHPAPTHAQALGVTSKQITVLPPLGAGSGWDSPLCMWYKQRVRRVEGPRQEPQLLPSLPLSLSNPLLGT